MSGQLRDGYWDDIFPFDPYEKQVIGINEAVDTLSGGGYHLLEGACGTGKTLIALTAGLSVIRDPDTKFQRILVITSKKQQLRAFEDDLEQINQNGNEYFEGLTLVGKADLCPYVASGEIDKGDIHHRCMELRDNTDQFMSKASQEGRVEVKAEAGLGLATRAEVEQASDDPLYAAGVKAPYRQELPSALGEDYCPFFAKHFVYDYEDVDAFDVEDGMKPQETLRNGIEAGTCPHAAMKQVSEDGEVLIGNYNHVFSPMTVRGFTGRFFNDSTLLIIDEAHELSANVRDQLSYDVTLKTFDYAIKDIEMVKDWAEGRGDPEKCSVVRGTVNGADYEIDEFDGLKRLLEKARDLFTQRVKHYRDTELGSDWTGSLAYQADSEFSITVQGEDDDGNETDILERWMDKHGADGDWMRALYLGHSVAYLREKVAKKVDNVTPEGDFAIDEVRELLHRWFIGDHTEYFREIKLNPRSEPTNDVSSDRFWEQYYHTEIRLNNCIPQDEIAATLDAFGGGMIMSATLEPLDVYREVNGIDKLAAGYQPYSSLVTKAASRYTDSNGGGRPIDDGSGDGSDDGSDDEQEDSGSDFDPDERKRNVETSVFEMDFPEENRASFAVKAPKFTWSDRWPPEENPGLRSTYRDTIVSTASTTPGNVIVFMPSYTEGEWAAEVLRDSNKVDKPVLEDESSTDSETERLKREFVSGEPKVLTTGLRGTLTEGVDFSGDKLDAAVICGVPIAHTGSELATAIEEAYSEQFGEYLGFDYAFTVPAVRKTRQALGRVIRGTEDVGVRVLADMRYTSSAGRAGVRRHFPDYSRDEFKSVSSNELQQCLERFWSNV
jgi:DNA excision repair protein ERCC-2